MSFSDTNAKQLREDEKILARIDQFGHGLSEGEIRLLESFMRWTGEGKPLTPRQRQIAHEIDERRVG